MVIISIIVFLLVFSLLVLVHELGHYFSARFFGVKVEEFGIGFPPRAFSKKSKKSGTLWSFNWVPLGGFVRMKGQDDFSLAQSAETDSFSSKSKFARTIILIAGVFMNYLLAIVLLIIGFIFGTQPFPGSEYYESQIKSNPSEIVIEEIAPGTPADQAGFQVKDQLLSIDNQEITSMEILQGVLLEAEGALNYSVERDENIISLQVTPDPTTHLTGMSVGAIVEINPVKLPVGEAIAAGFHETNRLGVATIRGLGILVTNIIQKLAVPDGVAGPVGIATIVGTAANSGIMAIIQITALLSISLAIINIMPFPALDGGRILFIIFELFSFGKKVPEKIEGVIHLIGFALIFLLLIFVTWNDIVALFQ